MKQFKTIIFCENYEYGGMIKFIKELIQNGGIGGHTALLTNYSNDTDDVLQSIHKILSEKVIKIKIFNVNSIRYEGKYLDTLHKYIARLYVDIRNIVQIIRILNNVTFENLIAVNGGFPASSMTTFISIIGKYLGKNVYYIILGTPLPKTNIYISLNYLLLKKLNNHIYVNSEEIKKQIVLFLKEINVLTIKNPISEYKGIKWQFNSKMRFLYVGRLVEDKGIMVLIDAFIEYRRLNIEAELTIIGRGELYDYILKLNIPGIILFSDFKGEVRDIMHHYTVLVQPSFHEGTSYVILEAMSVGLPCLISDIPANNQFKIKECASFFEVRSAASLSGALASLNNNQKKLESVSQNGIEFIEDYRKERIVNFS